MLNILINVYKIYTGPLLVQAQCSKLCPVSSSFRYWIVSRVLVPASKSSSKRTCNLPPAVLSVRLKFRAIFGHLSSSILALNFVSSCMSRSALLTDFSRHLRPYYSCSCYSLYTLRVNIRILSRRSLASNWSSVDEDLRAQVKARRVFR
jgi:hypothetical protein